MTKLKEAVSYSNDEIKIKRLKIKRICTISQYPSRPKFYAPENLMNVQILFFQDLFSLSWSNRSWMAESLRLSTRVLGLLGLDNGGGGVRMRNEACSTALSLFSMKSRSS